MAELSLGTRPVLMSKERGRYGRCDYKRFDNIASTHMRAGRGNIGKVEVECRFVFTKSQWGVIGEPKNPAGILYLDLDFRQPSDCRLESATVTVTLAEHDGEEDRIEHRSACPVKFTDYYGPKCIRGPESQLQTKKVKKRTPEVNVLGNGAGGFGWDKEETVQTTSRWKFSGHISSSKGCIWYNRLRWELQENSLECSPTHNNLLHTAFALEHNATRFYMTVHVSGKLARLSQRIKNRLKFGEKESGDEEIVTKIEWSEGYSCPLRLDRMARDLHLAMEYENMSKVPVELPSALPANFPPTITSEAPATTEGQQTRPDPQAVVQQPSIRPWLGSGLPPSVEAQLLRIGDRLSAPTLQDLSLAAGFALQPPSPPPPLSTTSQCRTDVEEASESCSATLVNPTPIDQTEEGSTSALIPAACKEDLGAEFVSRDQRGTVAWAGIKATLLRWLRGIGLLLLGVAALMGVHPADAETKTRDGERTQAAVGDGRLRLATARVARRNLRSRARLSRRGRPQPSSGLELGKLWEQMPEQDTRRVRAGRA